MNRPLAASSPSLPEFLSGGGEMGQLIRNYDWSKTSLGAADSWPQSLRTCIRIMLSSRQPIWIGWGKEFITFYNDPYQAIIGGKHPGALGKPASFVWKEIWPNIEPMLQQVMENGEGTYAESQLLIMERNGYLEEKYYTFSYTPIPSDDGVTAGIFCATTDDTDRIVSQRQLYTLTQLGQALKNINSTEEIITKTITTVQDNLQDFPFVLLYQLKAGRASLAGTSNLDGVVSRVPQQIELNETDEVAKLFFKAVTERKNQLLKNLSSAFGHLPKGAWDKAPDTAIILPVFQTGKTEPYGFLVVGLNPYRLFDEKYSSFFTLISDQLCNSLVSVYAIKEERKRAIRLAKTRRHVEAQLRRLFLQAPMGIGVVKGPQHMWEIANKRMLELLGREEDDIIGKPLFETIPEGKGQGFEQIFDTVYQTGERFTIHEAPIELKRYGKLDKQYIKVVYEPLREEDGTISGIMLLSEHITEQVIARKKLEESEQQFRNFSNNIQNLAWMADSEGYIYWYNQRWYDYTGTTLEEMKGWGWEKVHHPDHLQRVVDYVKEAWRKPEPFELTFPLKSCEGEYRWFLTRVVPVKDTEGKVYRWVGTNTDVHEQLLAEDRFRTLAETLPQLVWMTNEKGTYEYASSQWEQYSGLDPHKDDTWEKLVHPDDMPSMAQAWTHSLQTGEPYIAEARLKSKKGEYRWHFVEGASVCNEEGKIIKWIGAFTDIHDQKTLSEKLEALVQDRTKELQLSNESLQQFAHVASHDLKEPVRKIKTFSSRLEAEIKPLLTDKAKLYLDKVQSATDRMFTMIDGVLTYSTVNATEQKVEEVTLNQVLQNIETDVEVTLQQKGAVLRYKDLPVIEGAQILIYQLFYNLINNSLKFTKQAEKPVISITARAMPSKEWVEITVQDNGIGFNQEEAENIFDPFTRLHSKDQYDGTGLGLSLCKKIVERHHGTIKATGKKNEGASFIITLPYHQAS